MKIIFNTTRDLRLTLSKTHTNNEQWESVDTQGHLDRSTEYEEPAVPRTREVYEVKSAPN